VAAVSTPIENAKFRDFFLDTRTTRVVLIILTTEVVGGTGFPGGASDGGEKRAKSGRAGTGGAQIVWEYPACTVAEAAERLPGRQYARTTVLTVIQRLHAKGLLKRRKRRAVFRLFRDAAARQVLSRLITGSWRTSSTVPRRRSWPT